MVDLELASFLLCTRDFVFRWLIRSWFMHSVNCFRLTRSAADTGPDQRFGSDEFHFDFVAMFLLSWG